MQVKISLSKNHALEQGFGPLKVRGPLLRVRSFEVLRGIQSFRCDGSIAMYGFEAARRLATGSD